MTIYTTAPAIEVHCASHTGLAAFYACRRLIATVKALMASGQEGLLRYRELEAGAETGILLQVVLMRVVLRAVHQFEPGIRKVRIELGMIGCILFNNLEVGWICNERNICGEAHGLGKLARAVAGVPLVVSIPWLHWHRCTDHECL